MSDDEIGLTDSKSEIAGACASAVKVIVLTWVTFMVVILYLTDVSFASINANETFGRFLFLLSSGFSPGLRVLNITSLERTTSPSPSAAATTLYCVSGVRPSNVIFPDLTSNDFPLVRISSAVKIFPKSVVIVYEAFSAIVCDTFTCAETVSTDDAGTSILRVSLSCGVTSCLQEVANATMKSAKIDIYFFIFNCFKRKYR